jgi:hypothetical protein
MRIQFTSKHSFFSVKCIFILLLWMVYLPFGFSQNSDTPKEVTNTYYFKNINVVVKPGQVLESHQLILKNGLIDAVGKNLTVPAEAMVISADSLFAYPGFIDAFSFTGIPKTENKDQQKVNDPGNPPDDIAGITPQKSVAETYKTGDKSIGDMRSVGFTMSNVSPRGLMLPGKTSLLLHLDEDLDKVSFKKDVAMTAQFTTNRSVYPSTVIGVMSKFKDLYKNSEILGASHEKYMMNPSGLQRPLYKKEEWALFPVTQKKLPVFFVASSSNQVFRALELKKELGFSMVLVDVKQAWAALPELKKHGVLTALSLELPEEIKDKSKEESKDSTSVKKQISAEEMDFEKKKIQSYKQHVGQAAEFEKAGLPFSFSALNVKPQDIPKNIRRMVKEGLSEKAALEALTTNPATLLGVSSSMGTIEKGKVANIVVTEKNFFDEKSKIKYVFVDGKMFEIITQKSDKKGNEEVGKGPLVGVWSFTVEMGAQSQKGTMTISGKPEKYSISLTTDDKPDESESAYDIKVQDKIVTFSLSTDADGSSITLDFELNFEGNVFSGEVSANEMGTFPVKGEKKSNPNQ